MNRTETNDAGPMEDTAELVGRDYLAKRLGVHPNTVSAWVRNGSLIPALTLPGGQARFRKQDADAFVEGLKTEVGK